MAVYQTLETASFVAGEALSMYDVVQVATADRNIYQCDDIDNVGIVGIVQSDAAAGDCVAVGFGGVSKAIAGAAITRGVLIASNTSAAVVTAASNARSLGVALSSAGGAGEVIPVLISIGNVIA